MPKVLFLVRHAKSSWKDPSLADRDRPLNKRGKRDASRMGKRLAKHKLRPQLIVSSPVVRALSTTRVLAEELGLRSSEVVVEERIYGAGTPELIEVINQFDDRFDRVMLVGHNPTVTDLVNVLAGTDIENVPTCGIAVVRFETDTWSDVREGAEDSGMLLDFDYPKRGDDRSERETGSENDGVC